MLRWSERRGILQAFGPDGFHAALVTLVLLASMVAAQPAGWTLPSFAGQQVPTLAPLLRQVIPPVVNIAVRGRVREENPLFKS